MEVVLTLVQANEIRITLHKPKQYKNTVKTLQNTKNIKLHTLSKLANSYQNMPPTNTHTIQVKTNHSTRYTSNEIFTIQ